MMGGFKDQKSLDTLPTVDLDAYLNGDQETKTQIANEVDEICKSIGFLIIENHGVDQNIIDAAWHSAQQFFSQPNDQKLKAAPDDHGSPRGYTPIEGENLAKTIGEDIPPDRKETFSSGPLSAPEGQANAPNMDFFYGENIWPDQPNGFRADWISYYREMEKLGAQIMTLLAGALNLDDDYFVKYHTHHISALRCQNYPSLSSKILPGQLRAGAHSDYGSVTILKPDPDVGGLEVKSPNSGWIKAPVVKDGFIINIGDMLAHWTNGRWVSTLHRVVEPENEHSGPPQKRQSPKRQSIAYFMNPNYDAEISVIETCVDGGDTAKYPPVLAGDYLIGKFSVSN